MGISIFVLKSNKTSCNEVVYLNYTASIVYKEKIEKYLEEYLAENRKEEDFEVTYYHDVKLVRDENINFIHESMLLTGFLDYLCNVDKELGRLMLMDIAFTHNNLLMLQVNTNA